MLNICPSYFFIFLKKFLTTKISVFWIFQIILYFFTCYLTFIFYNYSLLVYKQIISWPYFVTFYYKFLTEKVPLIHMTSNDFKIPVRPNPNLGKWGVAIKFPHFCPHQLDRVCPASFKPLLGKHAVNLL